MESAYKMETFRSNIMIDNGNGKNNSGFSFYCLQDDTIGEISWGHRQRGKRIVIH